MKGLIIQTTTLTVSAVTTAMADSLGLVSTVLNTIAGHPILLFYMGIGFIGVGVAVFKKLKRAVR